MDQSSSSTANSYADYQAMVIQVSSALEALESLCGDLSLEENRRELEKCRKKACRESGSLEMAADGDAGTQ